jgi:hypothetical protein
MTGACDFECVVPGSCGIPPFEVRGFLLSFFATTALKVLTALNTCDRAIRWPAQQEDRLQSTLAIVPTAGPP